MKAQYSHPSSTNALISPGARDPKKFLSEKLQYLVNTAWRIIGGDKKILSLYPHLAAYCDSQGHPLEFLPIPPLKAEELMITHDQGIALAVLETYLYLHDYFEDGTSNLPQENIHCLTMCLGKLHESMMKNVLAKREDENVIPDKDLVKYVEGRVDPMKHEILTVMRKMEDNNINPTNAAVWAELINNCGEAGSCCISTQESDKGQIIAWRKTNGLIDTMNYDAFKRRMTNYRKLQILRGKGG